MTAAHVPSKNIKVVRPPVRPLVVPSTPAADEGLIGLIAKSTAANVLGTTRIILDEVGLRLPRPALVGQEFADFTERLALKIGCRHEDVLHRMHPYLTPPSEDPRDSKSNWRRAVRWGSGAMERHHLDLATRWISPSALKKSPHHRAAWMCKLLPYCTETLEQLIEQCGECGSRLGWRHARGIGTCEHCRRPILSSSSEPLPVNCVESYRRFAALMSIDDGVREAEHSRLPAALRGILHTDLTRLVIGLGRALDPEPGSYTNTVVVERADPRIASVMVRGFEALAEWPNGLRASLDKLTTGPAPPIDRREMLSRLRGVGGHRLCTPAHEEILRDAVPEIFETYHRSMSFREPVVLASESCALIGIKIARFRGLEDSGLITGVETTVGDRTYRQYSKRRVEEIAKAWRTSSPAAVVESYLGVPRYAVEQLVCLGRLTREGDPAILGLHEGLRLTERSIEKLNRELETAALRQQPPTDAISLSRLSKWRGGNMKPWASALIALARGDVSCWRDPDIADPPPRGSQFVRRTLVCRADAQVLFGGEFDRELHPAFPFCEIMCEEDACEALNTDAAQLQSVRKARALVFERRTGNGQWIDVAPVLALARRTITAGELSHLLNQNSTYVTKMLPRHPQVRRAVLGWSRDDVLANWPELIAAIEQDSLPIEPRRVAPVALPKGYAMASRLRLEVSVGLCDQ